MTTLVIVAAALAIAAMSFAALDPMTATISCALGSAMLAIAVSDARRFIVPDALSLPAIPAGLIVSLLIGEAPTTSGAPLMHLAAAAAGAAAFYAIRWIYFRLRARHGLGLGDVKLAAVAGAWTGFEGLSIVLLLATAAAMTFVLIAHVATRRSVEGATAVPFGAFLAPAIWLTWWLIVSGRELGIGGPAF